jgi:hypothetical protein
MRFWDIDDNASEYITGEFIDNINHLYIDGIKLEGIKIN